MFNSIKIKSLTTKMKKLVAKKDYYKTIDCANQILELDENNLLALKIKSDALRQLGDFESALECANIIVDLEPTSFNLSNQAVLLYFLGNVDDSFGILDNVLKNHADFKEAFNTKFTFLCELERYDEALELCDFALEKDSKFLDAFALKSKVYFDKGDYKKSIEYADQMRRMANSFVVVDSPNMKAAPETDFEFVITDGAAAITAYIGNDFHVLVPDTLDGAPVREIGETAFYESDVLEVVLPDSIEVIGPFAFSGCTHMVRLHLPSALKAVPSGMLESCFRLDWLNLEQTQIQTIGAAAFWGDQYLEEIGFPDTLESIEHDNFVMCDYLGYFSVSDTCVGFTTDADGQVLLSRDGKTLLHAGCWLGTDGDGYIVPDGVEIIRSYAFAESINLTTVTLPDSLREIGGCAFFNTALKELHIPAGVERIGTMITDKGPGTVNIGNGIKIYFGASGSAAETFCKQLDLNFVEEKQETETIK